jgi:hypothetical protein
MKIFYFLVKIFFLLLNSRLLIILGIHTTDFTVTNKLFLNNPERIYWRFEVIYTFEKENSSSSFIFRINQPPRNGSCNINPLNGTTNTLFTISCSNWFDENKIKDYFVYCMKISLIIFIIKKIIFLIFSLYK